MKIADLPKYHQLMRPTLIALDKIGGSASLNEINDAVVEQVGLSPQAIEIEYDSGAGAVIPDRLSWARSHLKAAGLLASGGRGIWLLTDEGRQALGWPEDHLKKQVAQAVRDQQEARKKAAPIEDEVPAGNPDLELADWRDRLLSTLKGMDPSAFERLCQRLLRESGFVKVEVTGRSGDGGIDGTGILQLSLMSFHVLFGDYIPCKSAFEAVANHTQKFCCETDDRADNNAVPNCLPIESRMHGGDDDTHECTPGCTAPNCIFPPKEELT